VFEELGVAIDLGPAGVERCVDEAGVGFCFAPRYHPAMRFLGPARKELGIPTTFNFLGPLANPARVRRQAVGVSDPAMAATMLATLRVLGTERAMVFSGDDGLDELTTTTTSTVHELIDGNLHEFKIDPLDVGIARADAAQLCGGDAATNAGVLREVLSGKAGPCRDIAVLNGAAALMVAGMAGDLPAGVEMAIASIDGGAAGRALEALVRVSQAERAVEQERA